MVSEAGLHIKTGPLFGSSLYRDYYNRMFAIILVILVSFSAQAGQKLQSRGLGQGTSPLEQKNKALDQARIQAFEKLLKLPEAKWKSDFKENLEEYVNSYSVTKLLRKNNNETLIEVSWDLRKPQSDQFQKPITYNPNFKGKILRQDQKIIITDVNDYRLLKYLEKYISSSGPYPIGPMKLIKRDKLGWHYSVSRRLVTQSLIESIQGQSVTWGTIVAKKRNAQEIQLSVK